MVGNVPLSSTVSSNRLLLPSVDDHIVTSFEGLEGSKVDISGGEITIVSSDDGVNAAGGADSSGFGGRGGENAHFLSDSGYGITISGGSLNVTSSGDGLDANGSITMTGGTVLVSSTGSGDGALDYDGTFSLEGGILLAACASSMAQAPTSPAQYTVSVRFDSTLPAGTYVQFAGEDQEFVFRLPSPTNHVVFSSPELNSETTYAISYGGAYSGESTRVLCSGGAYSGGTLLTELTISDYLTTYGQVGMGGSKGGSMIGDSGRRGSFGRNGWTGQDGTRPENPTGVEDGMIGKHGGQTGREDTSQNTIGSAK